MTAGVNKIRKIKNQFIDFKSAENNSLLSINRDHIVAIQENGLKATYVYVDVHDTAACSDGEVATFRVKGSYMKIRKLID